MSSLRIPGLLWLVSWRTPEPALSPAGSVMLWAFNELHTASIKQMFDTSGAVVSVGKRSSGWCGQNETLNIFWKSILGLLEANLLPNLFIWICGAKHLPEGRSESIAADDNRHGDGGGVCENVPVRNEAKAKAACQSGRQKMILVTVNCWL